MADQKRWFKVWTSITSDDDFEPSRPGGLISLGRFTILGAYTALHGEKGVVEIMPDTLFRLTQSTHVDELRSDLALKNLSFEEGKNRYGKITVTWKKWQTYQEDSTAKERMKALRSKRRGEEIRREERRREEKPPIVPLPGDAPLHPPGSLNPTKEPAYSESFRSFWAQYPRKQGKDKAWEVWKRKQLDTQAPAIMQKLRQQKTWRQWALEGGRYIPNPSTYLSQGRWKDEEGPADAAPVTKADVLADMMREAEEQEYGNGTRDHAVSSDAQRRLSGVAERPAAGTPAADIPRLRATPR